MPWNYTIDPDRDVIIATGTDVLTGSELMTGLAIATRDPKFSSDMRFFVDYHRVTDAKIPAEEMMQAAAHPAFSANHRRAFFVKPGFFATALNFAKCFAIGSFEVFTDRASAVAWLNEGVPEEKWLT